MLTQSTPIDNPRWKDLYRIGGISSLLLAGLVAFAVIAYFIWSYTHVAVIGVILTIAGLYHGIFKILQSILYVSHLVSLNSLSLSVYIT